MRLNAKQLEVAGMIAELIPVTQITVHPYSGAATLNGDQVGSLAIIESGGSITYTSHTLQCVLDAAS